MEVGTSKTGTNVNVLWDGGATSSLISIKKAAEIKVEGKKSKFINRKSGWGNRKY